MRIKNTKMVVVIAGLSLAMVSVLSISCKNKSEPNPSGQRNLPTVAVVTMPVSKGSLERGITLTGELEPEEMVHLSPKISGRLERLSLDDGTEVKENTLVVAGQTVAVLEHQDLKAQYDRAEAGVQTAAAVLKQAQADIEEKQRDKIRMENLFKEGSATEKQRDVAVTTLAVAQAAVDRANAQLAEAQAAQKQAKVMLDEAFLKSPISGVVSRKLIDIGNMVNPAMPVVSIVPMEKFKFLVDVPTQYLSTMDVRNMLISLSADAWPGRTFATGIEKVYSTVNPQTRTFTLELSVKNEKGPQGDYLLRPGMYATAHIVLERCEDAVVVPADSLVRRTGTYLAYVVENNIAVRKTVQVGIWSGNQMEVKSGLEPGQMLVVSGQHKLTDGTPVEVVKTIQSQQEISQP
jgi:RND family efflux transporter MFP subunit